MLLQNGADTFTLRQVRQSMAFSKTGGKGNSRLGYLTGALLCFLYFAGNVQFEELHFWAHSHNFASHSSEEEEDACHRTIFHNDVEDGCGHSSHLIEVIKCSLCDVIFQRETVITAFETSVFISHYADHRTFILDTEAIVSPWSLPPRAPPGASHFFQSPGIDVPA